MGKTRLGLAIAKDIAASFADGVAWVDLAPVRGSDRVFVTVARALGINPRPGRPVADELVRHLQSRQTLLLLDNCEHVLADTADVVARLLTACLALQVLITSRAPLHIRGEQVMLVLPFALPPPAAPSMDTLAQNDAVRLFVERARAVWPAFTLSESNAPTVAAICRALDGLPLAIELAAARITILSPDALLAQMTHRLAILRDGPRDAPPRQQTLQATIAWSYDLLAPAEQALFRRLAVFSGGATLEAMRAVASGWQGDPQGRDIVLTLSALVDHSLVYRIKRDGEPRFTTLETIREFVVDRLAESGENAVARDRHAGYFLHRVETRDAWLAAHLPHAQEILDHLETEYANLHAALTWLRDIGDVSRVVALSGALSYFWKLRGRRPEGRDWLEWGLAQDAAISDPARAIGQLALSGFAPQRSAAALALC
ncbi:MAG: hypothetical protein M3Q50_03830 [Chloroflexota bacterium]|nr:hypothetical protein [Chloroflexota bacterium]